MNTLAARLRFIWNRLITPGKVTSEMDDEMRFHIAMEAERLAREGGLSSQEAARRAAIAFGGMGRYQEEGREVGGASLVHDFARDCRQTARSLVFRRPLFAATVVGTLSLGIGASTVMYSALRAVVLDPVPFSEPEGLVVPWMTMGDEGELIGLDRREIEALKAQSGLFEAVEAYMTGAVTAQADGNGAELVATQRISAGLPHMLGISPVIGRVFTVEEVAGRSPVVILSYDYWKKWYEGRANVLGSSIAIDGESWTIIGVMPDRAGRVDGDARQVDLWQPLDPDELRLSIARLAPGVSVEDAQGRVNQVIRGLGSFGGTVVPVIGPGAMDGYLKALSVAVALLLFLACVSAANLLLQRASERVPETSMRTALGASRGRILRQLLLEGFFLSLASAFAGALLAWIAIRELQRIHSAGLDILRNVRMDEQALLFCLLVALLTGALVGLGAGLRGSRPGSVALLGRGVRHGLADVQRRRWLFIGSAVALTLSLLSAAFVAGGHLRELASRELGFTPQGLIEVNIRLPQWIYGDPDVRTAALERIVQRIREHPAAISASLTTGVPPGMSGRFGRLSLDDGDMDSNPTRFVGAEIDDQFLETLGQEILAGRDFGAEEDGGSQSVILGESAARRLFGSVDVLGRRLSLEGGPLHEVVGVVRDIRTTGLAQTDEAPLAYFPLTSPWLDMTVAVRILSDFPERLFLADVERLVHEIEGEAVVSALPVERALTESLSRERLTAGLLLTFSLTALTLAIVGLVGVMSQIVAGRTREIGIRMALGAAPPRIRRLILSTGIPPVLAGILGGSLLTFMTLQLTKTQVFGIDERWLSNLGGAAALLLIATCIAMMLPAEKAARLDPVTLIRASD